MKILVGNAPSFLIFRVLVHYSPYITGPKSIKGSSTESKAFLQVHSRGISI